MGRDVLESPETVLMKICIVSSVSEALELRLEELGVRCIVCCVCGCELRGGGGGDV